MPGPRKVEKEIDLLEHEVGQPHWLSPQGRWPEITERIRAKYRALHKAEREACKQVRNDSAPEERTSRDR